MTRARKWSIFLLKLALTISCLAWALMHFDWRDTIFAHPQQLAFGWIVGGVGFAGVAMALSGVRWWFFLRAQDISVTTLRACELTLIGGLFNLVSVGAIGGDAAKILLLIREYPNRKMAITMSVLVDHLSGMVALALMFFLFTAGRFDALAGQSVLGKGVIEFSRWWFGGGLLLIALLFVAASPRVREKTSKGIFARWEILQKMPEAYDVYRRNWGHALAGVVCSVAMLFVYFASFWCGARAVGADVSLAAVCSAMPVIDTISGMPVSVAGVGVREKLFLVLFGDLSKMTAEVAVAASLVGFACNVLWALVGGVLFLCRREHVTVKELEEV